MMSAKPNALQIALRSAGTVPRGQPAPEAPIEQPVARAGSRTNTVSLTFHYPPVVRQQLKEIALNQGRTLHDVGAEAFNLIFAHYGRAEVAPRDIEGSS